MDIIAKLREELGVEKWQVEAAVKLIDEGNTIPFISRYRKEATGSLNDEMLRDLDERLSYLRNLEEKKTQVIGSIEEQGKLTDELKHKILEAQTLVAIEDLYRPYRPKRKTRASVAKEKGLEPLAELLLEQVYTGSLEDAAAPYISEEKGAADAAEALQGAKDIIAERISDEADYRTYIREATVDEGVLVSTAKDEKQQSVYEMYYQYEEPVKKAAGHRILALNRGENEKILTVSVRAPRERILRYLEKQVIGKENPVTTPVLQEVIEDSYDRLIAPAIEREIRNELTEKAEDGAINVFGKNLEQLLMQPPIAGKVVLGWDPAFRTGCKLAVVDATGKVLDTKVIYPTAPQNKVAEAKAELKKLIQKYNVDLISVGNGTASRESEQVIVDFIKEVNRPLKYVIVNEAGASVYSASKLATEEFPQFDVGQRSAASIARRLQDPLAELVKIEPKAIGVGQYQHDMNQKKLGDALHAVVEDCVNKVGVDLNTASAALLEYISGISKVIAKNIVDYREKNGRFVNRKQLLDVAKLGPKAYEQCAGFLRIHDGENALDATSVHPESYEAAEKLMKQLGLTMEDVRAAWKSAGKKQDGQDTQSAGAAQSEGRVSGAGAVQGGQGAVQSGQGVDGARTARSGQSAQGTGKGGNKKEQSLRNGREQRSQFVIRNTNTAMGKALAAAMGGMAFPDAQLAGKRGAGAGNTAQAKGSGKEVGGSTSGRSGTNGSGGSANAGGTNANAGGADGAGESDKAGRGGMSGGSITRSGSVLASKISDPAALAAELGIGEITLKDIVAELEKPSRDPRESMPAPILRSDVLDMKDLKPGMILKGTVRNIVDFGAFVDIGVHQDGLVHISRITRRFIKHPLEAVSVGDIVDVKVLEVDTVKKRIALTMRLDEKE
ncbi:MAG: RNA-binding transcriptional accessory protein [Clostridium sp.]|nr:RNA-binding transcriptional accessory protein [Clostridium sp.]